MYSIHLFSQSVCFLTCVCVCVCVPVSVCLCVCLRVCIGYNKKKLNVQVFGLFDILFSVQVQKAFDSQQWNRLNIAKGEGTSDLLSNQRRTKGETEARRMCKRRRRGANQACGLIFIAFCMGKHTLNCGQIDYG